MITISNILTLSGEALVKAIQEEFDSKGLNDTKKARNSISYKVKGTTLSIEGKLRTVFLQDGRKPGTLPPIEPIRKWAERKLGVSKEESRGVAFAIAKKISTKGTDIFTNKAKGLQLELILDKMQNIVFEDIQKKVFLQINNTVFESLKS